MLPKNRRIPRKMFSLLSRESQVYRNRLLLLRFLSIPKGNGHKPGLPARFCFSVSKKISKSAVVRNRLRRDGYRLLTRYLPEIKSDILAAFSFIKAPNNEGDIGANLEAILKESKLIN